MAARHSVETDGWMVIFNAYPTPAGRALLGWRLYLPEHTWLADPDRCPATGIPDETAFATKPALATAMIWPRSGPAYPSAAG
ncbi:hypothetical protein GCM10010149_08300 [Nonomuraea roseoviolacea subsp. roseoviolacea]